MKKFDPEFVIYCCLVLMCWAVSFLLVSFACWSFSPVIWDTGGRALFASLFIASFFAAGFIYAEFFD